MYQDIGDDQYKEVQLPISATNGIVVCRTPVSADRYMTVSARHVQITNLTVS